MPRVANTGLNGQPCVCSSTGVNQSKVAAICQK